MRKVIDWDKVRIWQKIQYLESLNLIHQGKYMQATLKIFEPNPEIEKLLNPKESSK